MNTDKQPLYTLPLDHGYTLRVYCTRDIRQAAADFLSATKRNRRQSDAATANARRFVSIDSTPVLALE